MLIDRFLAQFLKDRERGLDRPLDEYLVQFPGAAEGVARAFLAQRDAESKRGGSIPPASSKQIGRYRILGEIGRGGQGVVYLARDLQLEREVAIKKLRGSFSAEELERFQQEARIASQLDHPGICPIYEIGEDSGEPYFVMRHLRGSTLATKIDELRNATASNFTFVDWPESADGAELANPGAGSSDPAPQREPVTPSKKDLNAVLRMIEQVARALHEAHEAGVIHRDVKPANVIVSPDGQPVLVDFGLATMLQADSVVRTETGHTPGTPPYMSPEQIAGGNIRLDRRTDVYSLGVTLYECVTLQRPFAATTTMAQNVLFASPPDPRKLNSAVSKELKTVLDTALEKDRSRRYATAAEFADDLRRLREHEPIKARSAGRFLRAVRWMQRNPAVAASISSIFLVLATSIVVLIVALEKTESARSAEREARILYSELADLGTSDHLDGWSTRLWPASPRNAFGSDGMEGWLAEAQELLSHGPAREASLHELRSSPGREEKRVRILEDLVGTKLTRLPASIEDMRRRFQSATTIQRRTIDDHRATWDEISRRLTLDPRFASISPLKPQLGLIPLGATPASSGLFEFALAETGALPDRNPESGRILVQEATAAILVLMPGGTLRFQPEPDTRPTSRDGRVDAQYTTIEPFFLGKHEICQAQWTRIMGDNPALGQPGVATLTKELPTFVHPVENITWNQCVEFCRRLGVQLPNQDQWEYGARSTGLHIWGDCDRIECLKGRENFADESLRKLQPDYAGAMSWNDGFQMHAPIGSLLPNAFGLHDMLGNVAEWCSDPYRLPREPSSVAAATPPPRSGPGSTERRRVIRGSSWQRGTREAACNYAAGMFPSALQSTLGLRVTRPVDR